MKRNILKIQALFCVAVSLTACGTQQEEIALQEQTTQSATTVVQETTTESVTELVTEAVTQAPTETTTLVENVNKKEGLFINYNGKELYLNEDINSVDLGTPTEYNEAPSCNYDGLDKVYTYNGISLYTYPAEGKDLINEIEVNSADILYNATVGIGKTVAQVKAVLGEPDLIEGDTYIYNTDNSNVYFYFENGAVSYWGISLNN